MVGALIAFASVVTYLMTVDLLPQKLSELLRATTSDPLVFLLLVSLLLFVVGMFLESNAAYIMLVPLLHPIALSYGIDPLHFGLLFVLNLVIGMLTPPVGGGAVRGVRRHARIDARTRRERLALHRPDVCRARAVLVFPRRRHRAAARAWLLNTSRPSPLNQAPRRSLHDTLQDQTFAIALMAGLLGGAAHADERMSFKVIGQPAATGLIQKNKEKPFFDEFAKRTGLPIDAEYKATDSLGIKDTEQLRVMKAGLFDIVSLRVSQNSRDEPTLLGFDLVGAAPDYETARKVYDAYFDVADKRLQKQFKVKLLGIWPFGPQILFCKKPIAKLADLKGMKVRVYDQNLSKFIESVGGTPVPLSFTEVHQSLSLGVVDCAITGPSSANSSNWPEVTSPPVPDRLPDGAQRLRHHAEGLEPPQARPAGQAADRRQGAHR